MTLSKGFYLLCQSPSISKCKDTKEVLPGLGFQVFQLGGLRPEPVSAVQLKHCAQVEGVERTRVVLRSLGKTGRAHGAHQSRVLVLGVREAPDPVAQVPVLIILLAAGHNERRLTVDEVETVVRDDDLVVLQREVALNEGLASICFPLQLVGIVEASYKTQEKETMLQALNL